jgi:hypothetical protein
MASIQTVMGLVIPITAAGLLLGMDLSMAAMASPTAVVSMVAAVDFTGAASAVAASMEEVEAADTDSPQSAKHFWKVRQKKSWVDLLIVTLALLFTTPLDSIL